MSMSIQSIGAHNVYAATRNQSAKSSVSFGNGATTAQELLAAELRRTQDLVRHAASLEGQLAKQKQVNAALSEVLTLPAQIHEMGRPIVKVAKEINAMVDAALARR